MCFSADGRPSWAFCPGYRLSVRVYLLSFFLNDTATTEIYTLSLHDALPISWPARPWLDRPWLAVRGCPSFAAQEGRSEEHTSELQSRQYLVCRLLLEKKKHHLREHLPIDHTEV